MRYKKKLIAWTGLEHIDKKENFFLDTRKIF